MPLVVRPASAYGLIAATFLLLSCSSPAQAESSVNVALGRPYTLDPAPNYGGRTSARGTVELTDGKVAQKTPLWQQGEAVGWTRKRVVTITIDLGVELVPSAVTWHGAAGSSGVQWPMGIYALGSLDGAHYAELGDIVAASAARAELPPLGHYADFVFSASVSSIKIRYLRLLVDIAGPYLFVDEIKVYDAPNVRAVQAVYPIIDTQAYFWHAHTVALATEAIRRDAASVLGRIDMLPGLRANHKSFTTSVSSSLNGAVIAIRDRLPTRAGIPLSPEHASLFATLGNAEAASGTPALSAWPANPWALLSPIAAPTGNELSHVDLLVMRGETRSGAFDLRNSTGSPVTVSLVVIFDGADMSLIRLAPVIWTGTESGEWVAAKIGPPTRSFTIPAGVTMQVWVTYSPGTTPPGLHTGSVKIEVAGRVAAVVPLRVRVFATEFPHTRSLTVSGWDYTERALTYANNPSTATAVAEHLQARGVTVPWAKRGVLDFGSMDSTGHMIKPPPTTALEQWLARWPAAARYRIFVSAAADIAGVRIESPSFPNAVRSWLTFWNDELKKRGRDIRNFELLLVDEPHTSEQGATAIAWSAAVKDSSVPVRLWVDPTWPSPADIPTELVRLTDTICINLRTADASKGRYWEWARELVTRDNKTVEVYGTDGPATSLDPYSYYRAAAWQAFSIGGTGVSFWSFSDTDSGDSSDGFAAHATQFAPFFIDHDGVSPGKHMEAIAEGARDFEYLAMLSAVAATSPNVDVRLETKSMLSESTVRVLESASQFNAAWSAPRDRSVADAWRLQIGMLLDRVDAVRTQ